LKLGGVALALCALALPAQAQPAPPAELPVSPPALAAFPSPGGNVTLTLAPWLTGFPSPYDTTVSGKDGRCTPLRPGLPTLSASVGVTPAILGPLVTGEPYTCDATIRWASGARSRALALPDLVLLPDPAVTPPAGVIATPAATAGPRSVTLGFTPLADPGVTGYVAMCIDGPSPGAATLYRMGAATGSPVTVTGLQAGVAHMCSVRPYNAGGTGPVVLAAATATPLAAPGGAQPVPALGAWALALLALAAGAMGLRGMRGRV